MRINFIRHGKTAENLEKRYIGKTDSVLSPEGIREIMNGNFPSCDEVICSPMTRCMQSALLMYPDKKPRVYDDFRECDFGDFEGKNYIELSADPYYKRWVESDGTLPFPNGESTEEFKYRCCKGFLQAVSEINVPALSFVIHGGTIMSIMEAFAVPKKGYFDYQIGCGRGYITEYDGEKITIVGEI